MSRRSEKSRIYTVSAVCSFLLLAVVVVFGQTVRHEFVDYDDNVYVYQNPHVMYGLTSQGIAWAFTTSHVANWHPLTWLSHMLDCQLYGLHAGGHHLTSVLLHAAVAILLFLVFWRMTGNLWPSALVAAVFAVHPLRAESVAWVTERKDILGGLFFVLTLGAYVGYVRHPFSLVRYLTVAALFALGLMAKPMLVTLPFVLLLLDYWPLGRMGVAGTLRVPSACSTFVEGLKTREGRTAHGVCLLLAEKIPLLLLTAASCLATLLAQGEAIVELEILPLPSRVANALVSCVAYLGQFFCPMRLAVFYPHPEAGLPIWKAAVALLVLVGISAVTLGRLKKSPYLFVGWFWYLGMLVPVIGLVQVGSHAMADRYTYLPQIGLCITLAWGLTDVSRSWSCRHWVRGGVAALAIAALMACGWRQTSYWHDGEKLWNRAIACTSDNYVAHNNLGGRLVAGGQFQEAVEHLRQALKIQPDYAAAHNNLGLALAGRGLFDEAIAHYRQALKIQPNYAAAHNHLGLVLAGCGFFDEAIARYRQALKIQPNYAAAHNNLANALACREQIDEALAHYQKALEIEPDYADAHNNLATILVGCGRIDEALVHYRKALEIKPDYIDAHNNLAIVLFRQGRVSEALAERREVIRLCPDDVALLNDTAWALATNPNASVRNGTEAVELAQRAVRLSGGREPAILDTLAAAYAETGRFPEAVQTARKALKLATQQNKQALVESIKMKILLYEAETPFRETPSLPVAVPIRL